LAYTTGVGYYRPTCDRATDVAPNTKLAKTRLIQEIEPRMLHQRGSFRGQTLCWCHWNLHRPTTVAKAAKICKF